jgi:phage terminase large subunit-like protein
MPKRPKKPDLSRAEKNIKWIEDYCRIPEGPDIGKKVRLRDWQKDEIKKIYDNKVDTRRAIISVGRKNAKTTLAAFLLLLHLCGHEKRYNSQLYSAAQSREQAAIIFALAAKIVRMSPDLRSVVIIRDTAKQLFCPELGTLYRALSAEIATAFGLSPVFIVHDELGQVRGPRSELYEALETATGAQSNPLSVVISTQAPTDSDLLSVLIDDALAKNDPRVVCSLHSAPKDADPFAEATIRLANPAFGDFLNPTEVLAMAEDARRMPGREADFRNLVLNQRVEASNPFIEREIWERCGAKPQAFGSAPVFGGLDLSAVRDLTALVLIGQADAGCWNVLPTFWLPKEGLRERSRLDRVPYDEWAAAKQLETTPGKTISYEFVAVWLKVILEQYNIQKIAFDRWNFHHLRAWLIRVGVSEKVIEEKFVEFGQGYKSMSPALKVLETMIVEQKLRHGNHPVLAWCAQNCVVTRDPADNRKLDKSKSRGRIDGMVALAMAAGCAEAPTEAPKEYQMLFV